MPETTFHFEWGGTADLTIAEVWPDGDAPENPTVDDVIVALRSRGDYIEAMGRDWEFDLQDIEVRGPGGRRSIARILYDERKATRTPALAETRRDEG